MTIADVQIEFQPAPNVIKWARPFDAKKSCAILTYFADNTYA